MYDMFLWEKLVTPPKFIIYTVSPEKWMVGLDYPLLLGEKAYLRGCFAVHFFLGGAGGLGVWNGPPSITKRGDGPSTTTFLQTTKIPHVLQHFQRMFFSIFELKNQKKIPVIYVVSSLSKEVKWQRCKKKLWPNYRWRKESLNYQVLRLWFWFCQQGVWRWLEYLKSAVRMMGVTQRAPGFNGPILAPLYGWNLSFFLGGEIFFKRFGIPFITGSSQLVMSDPCTPPKVGYLTLQRMEVTNLRHSFRREEATFDTFFFLGNLPLIESTRSH